MAHTLSLYELTEEQALIEQELIENGGEITPELEERMNDNAEALPEKVDGYNRILRRFEGAETALDGEIKRLTALKRTAQNAQKSIKAHVLFAMQAHGLAKLEGNLCKASIRTSQSLEVDEAEYLARFAEKIADLQEELPEAVTLETKVSKTVIRNEYKSTGILPAGCSLATSESVTIR